MKRIGLTQRVAAVPDRGERRDCLDQRWGALLLQRGLLPVPLLNVDDGVARYVAALALDGVILTGGNDVAAPAGARDAAPERDVFERELLALCGKRELPVLGVCRGAQVLALFHGGALIPVTGHAARRHAVTRVERELASPAGRVASEWPARFEVNSYHAFAISPEGLGGGLAPLALADDGSVEAVGHVELPQLGILWHPEREHPFADGPLDVLRLFSSEPARR
jgi:N5-(cytidine 5'-diphosphoramidyl)-L-glutamine hydrolase